VRDHLIGANFNFPERSQSAVARTNKPNKRLRLAGDWPPEDNQNNQTKQLKGISIISMRPTLNNIACLLAITALSSFMANTVRAAQIGDSVFVAVSVENRVPLVVSNDPQEVAHFVLDDGIWLVSGQVNFLSLSTPAGTMFTAANISVGSLSFEPPQTASITAEQVARLGNIIRNTSLVPRLVDVPDGTNVYLVGGSFNPNPNVSAWGFMTAVKIRNHVD
jgi:hypothetical protein